ncbi:MAG TPA: glutamine--fructose-6-phosphate transaminase (isomerizing) [Candidatus Thermoplasmatota archaeon]|nr:glutamine--fructose-6-phosphate transaminase (isomerizing) [Candidatus Thermoplasmatota archaeon]
MCGIIGYAGPREARRILLDGLKRLEYRGYDSAGIAVATSEGLKVQKVVGAVHGLDALPEVGGVLGIGHTRWATHGKPSVENAHPHPDCTGDFAVVHNGIIENYGRLRDQLTREGHTFQSETDTEVLAHLLEKHYQGNLHAALRAAIAEVEGSYAVAVLSNREPGVIAVARHKSPLILGLAEGATLIASDATPLLEHTKRVIYLEDGQTALVRAEGPTVFDVHGKPLTPEVRELAWSLETAEKGGFDHFMLKEIHEIPKALREVLSAKPGTLAGQLDLEGSLTAEDFASVNKILIVACGTSYHAGLIGRTLIERIAQVPTEVQLASEYRYGAGTAPVGTLVVGVSQSGETADTLEAIRKANAAGLKTLAVTNVIGSTLTREAQGTLYLRAGPEIGVAATKTFVNTLAVFYLVAYHLASLRGTMKPAELRERLAELKAVPDVAERVLALSGSLERLAHSYLSYSDHAFFLGRQESYGVALEGALKLKEISYIHAEGYAAGELKHGPLALLTKGVPVIACAPPDGTYDVMMSNITEVRARDASVIALVDEHNKDAERRVDAVVHVPHVHPSLFAVPATVALYLLSYHAAKARGCEIDKPRNLAKSVTVE